MRIPQIPTPSCRNWAAAASERFSCAKRNRAGWSWQWRSSPTRRRRRRPWWRWKSKFYPAWTILRSSKCTMRSILETNFTASWNCNADPVRLRFSWWNLIFPAFKAANYSRESSMKTLCWRSGLARASWSRSARRWNIYTAGKLSTWIWR